MVEVDFLEKWQEFATTEARQFCLSAGLAPKVADCLAVAKKHLNYVGLPSIYLNQDPDDGHPSVMILVTASGDANMASANYEQFMAEWTKRRGNTRGKLNLSYTIA